MVDYSKYITIRELLNAIHRYTEWVKIKIVNDIPLEERRAPNYLSTDVFNTHGDMNSEEEERILKYYGHVHVWNIHANMDWAEGLIKPHNRFGWYAPVIEANVAFSEMRDVWYREQEDIRREKRRQYKRERRKNKEAMANERERCGGKTGRFERDRNSIR